MIILLASCSATSNKATPPPAAPANTAPCDGSSGVGGPVPAGFGPGDLVAAVDLTPQNSTSPGFPTGARVWRVLYVSTGVDETDLQLICGMVASPTAGPTSVSGVGHLLSWSHGTVGLAESCLPSSDPANGFWGKMAGGIGAIAWTDGVTKRVGEPQNGALQYAMDQGWMVATSDYQPNDTYIVGKISGANQLDVMRAASQLMTQQFAKSAPTSYDTILWGHSQGGHTAMWAGQLFESYLALTKPSQPTAAFTLKGVTLLAPASSFISMPTKQSSVAYGDGLMDSEIHQTLKPLGIPLAMLEVQIGPALVSYLVGSWNLLSNGAKVPAPDAKFPAFPAANSPLELTAIATPAGVDTVNTVLPLCLNKAGGKDVAAATAKYRDAQTNQMLVPSVWNLPDNYKTGDYFKGGMDNTCATTSNPAMVNWCAWVTWNLPGPLGTNPYPKAPIVGGKPVPMMIAQGSDDTVVHCISPTGSANKLAPPAADCLSVQFYNTLAAEIYCPVTGNGGHLQLDIFRKTGPNSPASHFAIPGQASAKALKNSNADLVFTGSPVEQFFTRAFAGTLTPGCTATVLNP